MKILFKTFALATLIVSLNACGLFETKEPTDDPETNVEVPIEPEVEKIDSLNSAEGPAKDTGIIVKEEVKN